MSQIIRPSRRDVLAGGLAGLLVPAIGRGASSSRRNLVLVFAQGGWDVTYVFDPKLGVAGVQGPEAHGSADPEDVNAVQTFSGLPVVVNAARRPAVTAFFDKWAGSTCVINGVATQSIAHEACRARILTGTADRRNPDLAAIVGDAGSADLPVGYVDLSGYSHNGDLGASTGRVGYYGQINTLIDPWQTFDPPAGADYTYPQFVPSSAGQDAIERYLGLRVDAARARRGGGSNDLRIDSLDEASWRARLLREHGDDLIGDLGLGEIQSLATMAGLAGDLLRKEICRTVLVGSALLWDTHNDNAPQHGSYDDLFGGLDVLVSDLDASGLLDQTTIVVLSEMGRAPFLNDFGGKEHWPHTSAMVIGAGVGGGRVLGGTNDLLESSPVDLATGAPTDAGAIATYANLAAGVLEAMDVDPGAWLPGIEPYRGFRG
ncbi:MAG: DUF1501 domain-containing protein [Myxococcota bacterium]